MSLALLQYIVNYAKGGGGGGGGGIPLLFTVLMNIPLSPADNFVGTPVPMERLTV